MPRPDADPKIEERFRYGGCYSMAAALGDALGWPIEALVVDLLLPDGGTRPHIVHAWVLNAEGQGFDVAGPFDKAGLHETYLAHTGRKWANERIRQFASVDAYISYLKENSGQHWDRGDRAYFETTRTEAAAIVESYVIPRYLAAEPSMAP